MWVLLWIGTMTSAFLKEIEIRQLMQFYVPLYECLFLCDFFFFSEGVFRQEEDFCLKHRSCYRQNASSRYLVVYPQKMIVSLNIQRVIEIYKHRHNKTLDVLQHPIQIPGTNLRYLYFPRCMLSLCRYLLQPEKSYSTLDARVTMQVLSQHLIKQVAMS